MPTVQKILHSIESQWNILESFLLAPTKVDEFRSYLKSYRGLSSPLKNLSFKHQECAHESAVGFLNFFANIFSIEGLAEVPLVELQGVLLQIEKSLNLSFYYWLGCDDRNYQFRTWVHFFHLQGVENIFLTKDKTDFSISIQENGIVLGPAKEKRLAQIEPISKIFTTLPIEKYENLTSEKAHEQNRQIFARIRTLQREICNLIDEWEYQNSLLAVEYAKSFQDLQRTQSTVHHEAHEKAILKMDSVRNFYAAFSLESLCDIQEWCNFIQNVCTEKDILAELDALHALMLSATQKYFLPASISRLIYSQHVISLFQRFFESRLTLFPDDYSAQLIVQATRSASGLDFESKLFDVLKLKPFEWKFCFDPSSGLKAFCWAYNRKHHLLLCSLMSFCYLKKNPTSHLDDLQLFDMLNAFQTQEAFLAFLESPALYDNPVSISFAQVEYLITQLDQLFTKMPKKSEESREAYEYLQTTLSSFTEGDFNK